MKDIEELRVFLDQKVLQYETPDFLDTDPIQIPALFTRKQDIEIAGFLAATIAWGNRKSIIKNAHRLIEIMGNNPHEFVLGYDESQREKLEGFVHRTFNAIDLNFFFISLKRLYTDYTSMEDFFVQYKDYDRLNDAIPHFKSYFFNIPHPSRTQKHVSDPSKKSAAKRINMFFRWMVRSSRNSVDFGIWKQLSPSQLSCPLDVHSGNVARKLGILTRKQNDAKALLELDTFLRKLDPDDPVKYDFALFGLGVFEKF